MSARLWNNVGDKETRALSFDFMNKPIAVISDSYLKAENYMRDNFKLDKFDRKAGYYEADGQSYIVIVQPEQAMGYEFAGYQVVPNLPYTGDMQYLIAFVKSRIR